MMKKLTNGAHLTWDYDPQDKVLAAVISDIVDGQIYIVADLAVIIKPTMEQTEEELVQAELSSFELEYLCAHTEIRVDMASTDDVAVCINIARVECDVCTHTWRAQFPDDLERIECPHCENMVNFEIKD